MELGSKVPRANAAVEIKAYKISDTEMVAIMLLVGTAEAPEMFNI